MLKNKELLRIKTGAVLLLVIIFCLAVVVRAGRPNWQRKEVDWRMTGRGRIKAINYPEDKPPLTSAERRKHPKRPRKETHYPKTALQLEPHAEGLTAPVTAIVCDSPPIDGFVPWIAVSVTDARSSPLDVDAIPTTTVTGNYLTSTPESDYAVGIFDTGSSIHLMGNAAATQAGMFSTGLVTSNTIVIGGATGSTEAWISMPLGLFIDGLGAVEPNGLLLDTSSMVGQTNVAIAVGQGGSPDLPTAIGSPLSVYFAAHFRNDQQTTVTRDSNEFTGPGILFYDLYDPCIPSYSNIIPLELRPLGGAYVQYIYDFLDYPEYKPISPSIITGNFYQSIFFVASVDLYKGDKSAIDKDRFLFDTGAQITVIGSRVAARLELNPADPDFEVEIMGVTGDTIIAPGFFIDSLEIPALGEWLVFTDVPVILLDISSPEGGTVDGVIGMNLFVDLNFVLRGGGLFGQDDPCIEFGSVIYRIIADIAPTDGDGEVNLLDLAAFAQAWLAIPTSPNWNSKADMVGDARIDFFDFAVLAQHWLESAAP